MQGELYGPNEADGTPPQSADSESPHLHLKENAGRPELERRLLEGLKRVQAVRRAQEQSPTRLGREDLGLVISAGREKRFARGTPQPPRPSARRKK